jgi:hypothetical protein
MAETMSLDDFILIWTVMESGFTAVAFADFCFMRHCYWQTHHNVKQLFFHSTG